MFDEMIKEVAINARVVAPERFSATMSVCTQFTLGFGGEMIRSTFGLIAKK